MTRKNAGRGLDSFPSCAAIFQIVGAWCSDGAPPFSTASVLTRADQCFRVLPSLDHCLARATPLSIVGTAADLCVDKAEGLARPATDMTSFNPFPWVVYGVTWAAEVPVSRVCDGVRIGRSLELDQGRESTFAVAWIGCEYSAP